MDVAVVVDRGGHQSDLALPGANVVPVAARAVLAVLAITGGVLRLCG